MNSWFERFAKREGLTASALWETVGNLEEGRVDANLGGNVIKQRVARPGEGKSAGYRTIIIYKHGRRAFFVFGFPKSERENIEDDEERTFRKMAKHVLRLTDDELKKLLKIRKFREVRKDDKEKIQE